MHDLVFFIIIGAIAGVLAGLLGIGGGLIMVPGMLEWISMKGFETTRAMQISTGTALSGITVLSLVSGITHRKVGTIRWDLVRALTPGTVLGAIVGVWIADLIPSSILKYIFATVIILSCIQLLLFKPNPNSAKPFLKPWVLSFCGLLIGTLSSMIGLGGGLLIVPLLLINGLPMLQCASTSIWCTLPTVAVATAMSVWAGLNETDLLPHCIGYVYWPATLGMCVCALVMAPVGVRLAQVLPKNVTKLVLVTVMIIIIFSLFND